MMTGGESNFMKHTFYDVKSRQKVETEVVGKVVFEAANGQKRYAFKGQTTDGRSLTAFVGQATFDAASVPVI